MALQRKKIKDEKNTGFGNNADAIGNRLVNKDGQTNTRKVGLPFFERISWFHTLIKMKGWKFILLIFIAFLIINILFAIIYYFIGVDHLNGIKPSSTIDEIAKVYFFSLQTFTTVGYGHISPEGYLTSTVAAIEAFCGLLFFALATGLLYGRFARPNAYIRFSENALIAPYEGGKGLMLRLVPFKNNLLTDAEVKLTLAMNMLGDNGKRRTEFFTLKTEIDKINSLVLSWTIVHPIDEDSPLNGLTYNDIIANNTELLVYLKAFDETFSNTVIARTSYLYNEMLWGAKFIPMYLRSENQSSTVIEMNKLNSYNKVELV
jgi:inward rectifier potassium channel